MIDTGTDPRGIRLRHWSRQAGGRAARPAGAGRVSPAPSASSPSHPRLDCARRRSFSRVRSGRRRAKAGR